MEIKDIIKQGLTKFLKEYGISFQARGKALRFFDEEQDLLLPKDWENKVIETVNGVAVGEVSLHNSLDKTQKKIIEKLNCDGYFKYGFGM